MVLVLEVKEVGEKVLKLWEMKVNQKPTMVLSIPVVVVAVVDMVPVQEIQVQVVQE